MDWNKWIRVRNPLVGTKCLDHQQTTPSNEENVRKLEGCNDSFFGGSIACDKNTD